MKKSFSQHHFLHLLPRRFGSGLSTERSHTMNWPRSHWVAYVLTGMTGTKQVWGSGSAIHREEETYGLYKRRTKISDQCCRCGSGIRTALIVSISPCAHFLMDLRIAQFSCYKLCSTHWMLEQFVHIYLTLLESRCKLFSHSNVLLAAGINHGCTCGTGFLPERRGQELWIVPGEVRRACFPAYSGHPASGIQKVSEKWLQRVHMTDWHLCWPTCLAGRTMTEGPHCLSWYLTCNK